jgi:tetratricopeptide (TPR) repeat protein
LQIPFPELVIWPSRVTRETDQIKGYCYEKLNKFELADKTYMAFLAMVNDNPQVDTYEELVYTYISIANRYVSHNKLKKARLFLKKATARKRSRLWGNA